MSVLDRDFRELSAVINADKTNESKSHSILDMIHRFLSKEILNEEDYDYFVKLIGSLLVFSVPPPLFTDLIQDVQNFVDNLYVAILDNNG